jgi:hypothetical protein
VFYFDGKKELLDFLDFLKNGMEYHHIEGKIQWRRACKEYQNIKPELWKSAKEFLPDVSKN